MEKFAKVYEKHIDTTLLQAQCQTAKVSLELEQKDENEDDTSILPALAKLSTLPIFGGD